MCSTRTSLTNLAFYFMNGFGYVGSVGPGNQPKSAFSWRFIGIMYHRYLFDWISIFELLSEGPPFQEITCEVLA